MAYWRQDPEMPTSCHRIERDDPALRSRFCDFVQSVFKGANFHLWAAHGGWSEDYDVWVAIDDGNIVSGVGVMRMDLIVHGRPQAGWQVGAVATAPEWRGRGLSRRLLNTVLAHLDALGEAPVFLFANSSMLDFYPKFGFRRVMQQQYRALTDIVPQPGRTVALDIAHAAHRAFLEHMYRRARPLDSVFSAVSYCAATIFHLLHHPRQCVHLPQHDLVAILRQEGDHLHLDDVVSAAPVDLRAILPLLAMAPVRSVEFGFRPTDLWGDDTLAFEDREMLFLRGAPEIQERDLHFPDMAHT
jgi:predicted N-acetyltransferase YhbS